MMYHSPDAHTIVAITEILYHATLPKWEIDERSNLYKKIRLICRVRGCIRTVS